jgi:hypothetical protein
MRLRRAVFSAYTMTELLVATSVSVAIAGALFWGFARFNQVTHRETARLKFLKSVSDLREKLAQDLRVAVLNNSSTVGRNLNKVQLTAANKDPGHRAGVSTFIPQGSTEPTLQFFRPFNEEFSARASVSASSAYIQALKNATSPPTNNADLTYFWHAIRSGLFFSITNFKSTEIVQKASGSFPLNQAVSSIPFTASVDSSVFANTPTFVRTAERIQIQRDSATNRLNRLSSFRSEHQTSPQIMILAENVTKWRVGMTFEDRENEALILPASSSPINRLTTADNLPRSYWEAWTSTETPCAEGVVNTETGAPFVSSSGAIAPRCVKPKNLSGLAVRIVMETDLPTDILATTEAAATVTDDDGAFGGFRYELTRDLDVGGPVVATIDFYIDIESHRRVAGGELAQGQSGACLNPTQSRCRPECSSAFRDTDINSPWWIGYGRHAGHTNPSSFCKGWNPNPESVQERANIGNWATSLPLTTNWTSNTNFQQRMNDLGKHYGCITEVIQRHPGYRLACDCLRGGPNGANDHFITPQTPDNRPEFNSLTAPETKGYRLLNGLESPSGNSSSLLNLTDPTNPNLRCTTYGNNWDKNRTCDQAVQDYFGLSVSNSAFLQRCQCLSTEIPYACDLSNPATPASACAPTSPTPIHRQHIDFRKICNIDWRRNGGALACPNTMFVNITSSPQLTVGSRSIDFSFWPPPVNAIGQPFPSAPNSVVYNQHEGSGAGVARAFALSNDLARACECFEKEGRGIYSSSQWTEGPQNNPDSFPLGLNMDFRENVTLPAGMIPNVPASASNASTVPSYLTFSPQSWATIPTSQCQNYDPQNPDVCNPYLCIGLMLNGVLCWVGNQAVIEPTSGGSCADIFCKLSGSGPNCCQAGGQMDGWITHSAVTSDYQNWSSYCSSRCQPRGSSPLLNEINQVRAVITGTSVGSLPATCGGGSGQGGSSQSSEGF